MGWFRVVRGHPMSLKIAPFDKKHTSSNYRYVVVTISLSCTVFEIYRDIGQKLSIVNYPISIWRPHWGRDPVRISSRSLASIN